jgi:hypothetical protein
MEQRSLGKEREEKRREKERERKAAELTYRFQ